MCTQFYLLEALEKEPELSEKLVKFDPDPINATFSTCLTGYKTPQIKTPKQGLGWHPFIFNGFVCVIPEFTCIKSNMIIDAKVGEAKERKILTMYSQMYVNRELGGKGLAFETQMLPHLPKGYVENMNRTCYVSSEDDRFFRYLHVLIPGGIDALYSYDMTNFVVVPVVQLPKNVIVTLGCEEYDGSSVKKALRIFRIGEL